MRSVLKGIVKKGLGEVGFNAGGGAINWFPGQVAAATRAIRDRLKLADLVIEVRDSRIPLSSANEDLQAQLAAKRRVIALNKKDLANPNVMQDLVTEVQCAVYKTVAEFNGNVEDENDLENLIEQQFEVLQKALKIPHKASEARLIVSKNFLTILGQDFRRGRDEPNSSRQWHWLGGNMTIEKLKLAG